MIKKTQAKIVIGHMNNSSLDHLDGWSSKLIPELLGRVWHEFLVEETANFVKKYKSPKVNFKFLQQLVIRKTKETIGV